MIRPSDHLKEGLNAILRHKLRSALTLLGVVFGIAAVITMLGIGTGAQRTVLSEISGMGLRNMRARLRELHGTLRISSRPHGGTCVAAWLPRTDRNPE